MIDIDHVALRSVGLTPALLAAAAPLWAQGEGEGRLARVTEVHRDRVQVHDGRDESAARLAPALARVLADQGTPLCVGDFVLVAGVAPGCVQARVPPLSQLARRDPEGRRLALVSNVDTALLVMGLDADFSPRRVERYLALVKGQGVLPVVVLTKADLAGDDVVRERGDGLRRRLPADVDVLAVDATAPEAAVRLAPYLTAGTTLVLLGSSGAGKSTLTNTLLGSDAQATGAVRSGDGRGRHTTTSRTLFRLPQGACLIDTPGVRTLRPDVDEAGLAESFEDIAALAARCRYRDCRHDAEPGCAVREGVDADRLGNYHRLLRDVRRDTMTSLDRQRERNAWKARTRSAGAWMKAKRGG